MKIAFATLALAVTMAGCGSSNTGNQAARDGSPNTLNNNPNYPENPAAIADAPKTVNVLASQDRHFVDQAADGGAFEIQSGQLALRRSNDADIKTIAQRLIVDHKKLGSQLETLAKNEGMNVNGIPDADQQKSLDTLNGLSGTAFDAEFLKQQDAAHQQTLLLFQQEQGTSKDTALQSFAADSMPVLAAHLKMIQDKSKGSMVSTENP